jgi:hypothetical protein
MFGGVVFVYSFNLPLCKKSPFLIDVVVVSNSFEVGFGWDFDKKTQLCSLRFQNIFLWWRSIKNRLVSSIGYG